MGFTITNVPQGLDVRAYENGSKIPLNDGTLQLAQNGTAMVALLVTMESRSLVNGSGFDVNVVDPGSTLEFGFLGFMAGTLITTLLALVIAVPLALGSAVFLALYSPPWMRKVIKPTMEVLAGIPSVIFGLWGALTFGPFLAKNFYPFVNDTIGVVIPFFHGDYSSSANLMTASIVLGIMIFPMVMSLSYEAIIAVPPELIEGSTTLGASKWQTIRKVVLRKASSGIYGSIILGTGRAIGETMAVLMILGFGPEVPTSVFSSSGTMTSAIATSLTGVFSTTAARQGIFAIALILFVFVLILNALLIFVMDTKFRERYRLSQRFNAVSLTNLRKRFHDNVHTNEEKRSINRATIIEGFSPSSSIRRQDIVASGVLYIVAILMLLIVAYIIGDIIVLGGLKLQLTDLTQTQLGTGFLNSITGSLMLLGVALVAAVPITILAAIYLNEYTDPSSLVYRATYISVSTLSSTPSIIFGAFGLMLFILYLGFGFSLLSAGLTLACMILPLLFISNLIALKNVPSGLREASFALGITKWQTVTGIVIPASVPTISRGVFIGMGRAIGETAAVLLTAGFLITLTTSVVEPVASMPTMIYNLYDISAGNPVMMEKVYAAAFVLIFIVILLNVAGMTISYCSIRRSGR